MRDKRMWAYCGLCAHQFTREPGFRRCLCGASAVDWSKYQTRFVGNWIMNKRELRMFTEHRLWLEDDSVEHRVEYCEFCRVSLGADFVADRGNE